MHLEPASPTSKVNLPPHGDRRLEQLLSGRTGYPAAPCVTAEGRAWSYADIGSTVSDYASALKLAGVDPGDVVATVSDNRAELLAAFVATWTVGAAVAPVNPLLTPAERDRLLERLQPAIVLYDTPDRSPASPFGSMPLVGPSRPVRPLTEQRRRLDADAALILHSSGTTGTPKAVVQTHRALRSALDSVMAKLGGRGTRGPGDRRGAPNLIAFPLSHLAGIFNVLLALRNDREILLMRRFDPDEFLRLVESYQLPSVVLNPTMIHMLVESPSATRQRLSPLRFVRSGSAPLPAATARRFYDRFGIPVLNAYGQTETGGEVIGWSAVDVRDHGTNKLGAVGRPHPGVDIRFVNEIGAPVPPGEIGELCVRGRSVLDGYLDGSRPETVDGYLRTGDLGYVDSDGFVWLVARKTDVINRGGFKVMPEELEDLLRADERVAEAMVAGIADERLGEVPVAFVVQRPGAPADLPRQLLEALRGRVSKYKVPVAVHLVDHIPKNAMGKIVRKDAHKLHAQQGDRT